ncbi:anthocyanidin 3-O-glucoside 6' [Panicum miliaceum]|uniref:Anthocyanidin 3-O-glucoside 6 n=1 Tax=Panicum miliaceum TaxID=4540 RepID=A0A3L6QJ66_PANMI|nr:anthocyanidin 3-O-glucoside 6' [Panicum miliaceum]
MSSSRVRVLNVCHVLPAAGADEVASPHRQPLPDDRLLKLSFMDCLFVGVVPMQRLFFYEGPGVPPFPCLVQSLRSSLAAALGDFLPLAGKLDYRPSAAGGLVVDCSPAAVSPGVRFVEAQYDGSIGDMRRLACGEEHDPEALVRLGPELEVGCLPAPVLAVQVTRPAAGDGGVVVGVSVHHAVADGHSVWQFMRAWSAVSRSSASQGLAPRPTFDRAKIRHPEAEELARRFLHTIAPALPTVVAVPPHAGSGPAAKELSDTRRSDPVGKERIMAQSVAIGEQLEKFPSTYVAVSSLVWTSIVRAKALDHGEGGGDDACYFLVPVDCRRHLPGAGEGYFGNCLSLSYAKAAARDLTKPDAGVAHAAAAIRDAAREKLANPLRGAERWAEAYAGMPRERFTPTGSSDRFMVYETDMGWGAPSLVELVSPSSRGMMLLLGAPNGGVQVTVDLDGVHMDHFAANFLQV